MKKIIIAVLVLVSAAIVYAGSRPKQAEVTPVVSEPKPVTVSAAVKQDPVKNIKVTFIELGSVRCIPCKAMVPIMKEVEKKYGNEVKVIFYDVWTAEGQPYASSYKVSGIPTQVFLDENGKEFHRHMGFYPREQLFEVLRKQGVNIK